VPVDETAWRQSVAEERSCALKRLAFFLNLAAVVGGLAIAVIAFCNPNPGWAGVGWMISMISLIRLLTVGPTTTKSDPRRLTCRLLLAGTAALSLTVLIIQVVIFANGLGPMDQIFVAVLTVISLISVAGAVKLAG
jgi:hypothetical protein